MKINFLNKVKQISNFLCYHFNAFVFIIEYGNDWTMQHNWSDWKDKYPYVDFSGQAKTDDARIFFAYSNPDSKELSNFLRQYTH